MHTCIYIYIYIYLSLIIEFVMHYVFFLTKLLLGYENNGFSKFISIKKFDYKYRQTAVIIHLEIIYSYFLGIILLILILDLKLNETK